MTNLKDRFKSKKIKYISDISVSILLSTMFLCPLFIFSRNNVSYANSLDKQVAAINDPQLEKLEEKLNNGINVLSTNDDNINVYSEEAEGHSPSYSSHIEETPVVEVFEEQTTYESIKVVVSYYTSLAGENGGYAGLNAIGGELSETSIAIPRPNSNSLIQYGTVIEFDDLGEAYMEDYNGNHLTRVADDTGNPNHIYIKGDGTYRVDVFCPRLKGESDSEYKQRVLKYGKHRTTARVIN